MLTLIVDHVPNNHNHVDCHDQSNHSDRGPFRRDKDETLFHADERVISERAASNLIRYWDCRCYLTRSNISVPRKLAQPSEMRLKSCLTRSVRTAPVSEFLHKRAVRRQ